MGWILDIDLYDEHVEAVLLDAASLPMVLATDYQISPHALGDICERVERALKGSQWSDLSRQGGRLAQCISTHYQALVKRAEGTVDATSSPTDDADSFLTLRLSESAIDLPWEIMTVGSRLLGEAFSVGREVVASDGPFRTPEGGLLKLPVDLLFVTDSSLPWAQQETNDLLQRLEADSRFRPTLMNDPAPGDLVAALPGVQILHFAGHGQVDPNNPMNTGWVLGGGLLNEDFIRNSATEWPALVFANACPPDRLRTGALHRVRPTTDKIAVAMLRQGVRFYVGTLAPIIDGLGAATFALGVYDALLRGVPVGAAVRQARHQLAFGDASVRNEGTSIAAAHYFLYGRPAERLFEASPLPHQEKERLGPYTIEAELAASAYHTLYGATSNAPGMPARVVLSRPHDQRPAIVDNQLEAFRQLQPKLDDPGLVPILDVNLYDGELLVAYENVEAQPLSLDTQPAAKACASVVRIAEILGRCHRSGINHGDFSPSDVLVTAGNEIRILNVGRAEVLRRVGLPLLPGPAPYRSPEQWGSFAPRQGAAPDLWALAILAYQLIASVHPFGAASSASGDYREAVLNGDPEPIERHRSDLPWQLGRFFRRALARSAQDRYQTADEFVRALRFAVEGGIRIGGFEPDLEMALVTSHGVFCIETDDEFDTLERLAHIAEATDFDFRIWSVTGGLFKNVGGPSTGYVQDPVGVIHDLMRQDRETIQVLLDYDAYLDDWPVTTAGAQPFREVNQASAAQDMRSIESYVREYLDRDDDDTKAGPALAKAQLHRVFKDFQEAQFAARRGSDASSTSAPPRGHKIIIVTRQFVMPADLEKTVLRFRAQPATFVEVEELIHEMAGSPQPWASRFAWHAAGLSASAVKSALRLSIARRGVLSPEALIDLMREKEQAVRRSELLELSHPTVTFEGDVVGMQALRDWFETRLTGLAEPVLASTLPRPKGLVLGGLPGSGKSLCAQAIAGALRWPLLRLDFGRIFAGELGKAESNVRQVLELSQTLSPAVLWIDDIDKGLGGAASAGGVMGRVLNTLLTWLQERANYVLLVATVTDPTTLPPEVLRAGRFDAIFFLDWPTPAERADLIRLYLTKNGRGESTYDLAKLASYADNVSSADLAGRLEDALFTAASHDRVQPTESEIAQALTRPPPDAEVLALLSAQRARWRTMAIPASYEDTPAALGPPPSTSSPRRFPWRRSRNV